MQLRPFAIVVVCYVLISISEWRALAYAGEAPRAVAVTQHDVAPILLRRCVVCHGPHRKEGGLDLRSKSSMLKGGKSGPAIVLGKPEKSLLIKKVRAGQMPPPDRLVEVSVKPIEPAEVEILSRWIAASAPEVIVKPDVATAAGDMVVTDKDRDFWAFRAPKPVAIPRVQHESQVRNPIDAFILEKLEAKGLALASEADRLTLLRRAHFDLTGLPPTPEAMDAFLADARPDAYEKMIDRLLASPHYGERWGRRWLDLAGYADSEGKREQDLPRPHAWRYRDYVIRAFNSDKPYARFLLEQLAGDELADYEHASEISQELYDNLVATGFLRMAPDATWANITGYLQDRIDVIADEIDVLGSAVMGLTLKCARCHNHKFDPLPQRDYFRLLDVFKGAYDEQDWLKPDVRPGLGPVSQDVLAGRLLPHVTTAERRAWELSEARITGEIDALKAAVDRKAESLISKHVVDQLRQAPDVLRDDLKNMLATPPEKRTQVQKYLAEKFETQLRPDRELLKKLDPEFKKESDAADARIASLKAQRRPEPRIQALWDRGSPTPTYIYRRGDPLQPTTLVGPGVPSMLTDGKATFEAKPPWPSANKTGRRLAFARWLTNPDHPLTARVLVNRVWKLHFGAGIVATLGNFGKSGSPPTHPELLDWLARQFVEGGWSIKTLHRLMMTSASYRQSSRIDPERERLDPSNVLYSRMPLVRLDAESLYDTLLFVAGRLDQRPYGPADAVVPRRDGLISPAGTGRGWRRLIYVQQSRKQMPTHLDNFDFPAMNPNCVERRDSTVATQALYLMNNAMVDHIAEQLAQRVRHEAGDDSEKKIDCVYRIAFNRPAASEEKRFGLAALSELTSAWIAAKRDRGLAERKALETYCHALLNAAAFLYID